MLPAAPLDADRQAVVCFGARPGSAASRHQLGVQTHGRLNPAAWDAGIRAGGRCAPADLVRLDARDHSASRAAQLAAPGHGGTAATSSDAVEGQGVGQGRKVGAARLACRAFDSMRSSRKRRACWRWSSWQDRAIPFRSLCRRSRGQGQARRRQMVRTPASASLLPEEDCPGR